MDVVGARRGVHGHCKPTPSRPLCSCHPHQPAAPPANESARPDAVWRYSPGKGRRSSRTIRLVKKKKWANVSPPSHTGDAKHPAGLQRDPAKLRQGRERSEATSARSAFQNKRQRVTGKKSGWKKHGALLIGATLTMTRGHPLKYASCLKNAPHIVNKIEDNAFNPLFHALQKTFLA